MDSKTKIVVLHTKELIYTAVFALLCILLIVLLFVMFGPGHTDKKQTAHKQYTPGTYTSTLTLNNTNRKWKYLWTAPGSIPSGLPTWMKP